MSDKKKVLFVATVVKTHINVFHIPYLKIFQENGYETYVCAKNDYPEGETCRIPYCDHFYDIPFSRNPFGISNMKALNMMRQIVKNYKFDIIHCHTPVGGAVTRLVMRSLPQVKSRVIYTAHGFHFYKGCPLLNWICYYPIEKYLAKYTDILITINREDYLRAKGFKAKRIEYVRGVGIDIQKFSNNARDIQKKKDEIPIYMNDIVLLSVGELIKRKNHSAVIKAIAELQNPDIKYLICGTGKMEKKLACLIQKLGVERQVFLLGFRNDISELCQISDIFVFPSFQEGLSVALMEAMACSLPIIASDIRGNNDLIKNGEGGYLVPPKSVKGYKNAIAALTQRKDLCKAMGAYNQKAVRDFSLEKVSEKMKKIYFEIENEEKG